MIIFSLGVYLQEALNYFLLDLMVKPYTLPIKYERYYPVY